MNLRETGTTNRELQKYLARIIARREIAETPFIERKFAADEKWRRYAGSEVFRYSSILREKEPDLDALLSDQRIVVVGEPGSGKSTIAQEAAARLTSVPNTLPVVLNLRSYRGNLQQLIDDTVPPALRENDELRWYYICDGLDEIPREHLARAIREIVVFAASEHGSGVLITSRQAFFGNHAAHFITSFEVFHLLEFDEDDLRSFARNRGLDPAHFLEAAEEAGIGTEIRNPLNVWTISNLLLDGLPLNSLRSENLNTVIEGLLRSRTTISLIRLRRAVQLLGVSMEVYSRNELSLEEAKRILTIGLAITQDEAQGMLDELMQSILLQTPNGIVFQLRTYGEFLAAFELQNQPLDRIQALFSLDDGTPNPSWLNAVALLAELSSEVRRYFIRRYPAWVLGTSASAFTTEEKTEIVDRLLSEVGNSGQYLFNHPTIRAYALARILTAEAQQKLNAQLTSDRPEMQANAFLVLGLAKDKSIITAALAIAIEVQREDPVRLAALTALTSMNSPELLDVLIPVLSRSDLHYTMMLECIGMNVAEDDIERAIPFILSTNTLLTGVYHRFRGMRAVSTSLLLLGYLSAHPDVLSNHHAEAYFEPLLKQLTENCNDAIVELLVQVLIATEGQHVYVTRSFDQLLIDPIIKNGQTERTATFLLLHYSGVERLPHHLAQRVGRWLTMRHAEWIVETESFVLLQNLSPFIPLGEVRQFLSPHTLGLMEQQEQNSAELERQEGERQQQRDERFEALRNSIVSGTFWEALNALATLDEKEWPAVPSERLELLSRDASDRLQTIDLATAISYGEHGSWHQPPELQPILRMVDHYELRLATDESLVWTLKAWPGVTITNHYKRYGFSKDAAERFVEFVRATHERATPLENVLSFLDETDFAWPEFTDDLLHFVHDPQSGHLGPRALSVLIKRGLSTENLVVYERSTNESIRDIAFSELVRRQDRATISRALAELMNSPENLRDSDVGPPRDGPASWIVNINSGWAWDDLARLRRLCLQNGLVYLCDTVTTKLRKIDVARLARTVRAQMSDTPDTGRSRQSAFAVECEREGLILAAQSLPFDRVLTLLKRSTSLTLLKVYVEGSSDVPLYARLLREIGEIELAEKIDVSWGMAEPFEPAG
jgi:hypothetical protein